MIEDLKPVTLRNPTLKGFKSLVLEFNNLSAIETDQVIMMSSFRSGFISGLPISKFPLGCQAETGEELQGAIDGYAPDFRICFSNLGINLVKALMPGQIQEDVENLFPLFGCLQPFFRNPCPKEFGFNGPSSF
jgi:hypothetical protein